MVSKNLQIILFTVKLQAVGIRRFLINVYISSSNSSANITYTMCNELRNIVSTNTKLLIR